MSAFTPIRPTALRSPTWAIPSTTVQKMMGAINILISLMKPSANGFRFDANSGNIQPTRMPPTMPTSSWKKSDV